MSTKTSFCSVTSSKDYKKTEVGLLPIDWGVAEFGDLVSYKKGFAFKSSAYEKVGVRVIRVSDTTFTDIKDEDPIFVSEKLASQCSAWSLRSNDLVFTTVGSKPPMYDSLVGKAILVTEKHDGSLLNQNAVRIRAKASTKGIQTYLLNHFRTERYIEFIEMIYRGNANQASITLQNLFEFKIPLPSSEAEQTAIANALSDVDALIQELEKLIAKKQAIKTATMQQLLTGRTRLPPFGFEKSAHHPDGRKKGYKPSELGEIPEDWEVGVLGEICDFENGDRSSNYPAANEFSAVGIPFINAGHVSEGLIDSKNMDYIPRFVFDRLGGGKVKSGDLVYCLRGSLGKFGVITDSFGLGAVASSLVIVRPNKLKTSTSYLNTYFKSEIAKKMISLWAGGAAQPNLGAKELAKFSIPLPARDEQIAISSIFTDMDEEVLQLEQRLTKTRQIKQGMMQELLTGKTRLVKPAGAA